MAATVPGVADSLPSGAVVDLRRQLAGAQTEVALLRRQVACNRAEIDRLSGRVQRLGDEVERLRGRLAEAQRAGKRQASPFSRGDKQADPKRPGRKAGEGYGTQGAPPAA